MPPPDADSPPPPTLADLATRWQALAGEWAAYAGQVGTGWNASGLPNPFAQRAPAAVPAMPGWPGLPGWPSAKLPVPAAVAPSTDWRSLLDQYEMQLRASWRTLAPQAGELPPLPETDRADKRFSGPEWSSHPYFELVKHAYLLHAHFMRALVERLQVPPEHRRRLSFAVRQLLDAAAPSNFAATNPEAIRLAIDSNGESLQQGLRNLLRDAHRGRISMTDEAAFEVGRNLAITPGAVVLRNELIELIQYRPTTPKVRSRPLVIIPPCINKYYVLDLQPENSFVRYAVEQGHPVFIVSWRNIPAELGHLTWDDYLEKGVLAAFDAALSISRSRSLNALGFCVGGTLLACALAVLAARGDKRVTSATYLTTMLDFADPGEIGVYLSEELLTAREPALLAGARIHGGELATAFASLRANDLVWNYVVNNYLKGRTPPAFDLLYWNSDSANLPGPMYVYYLRNMYLGNRLRERGALTMLGEEVDLGRSWIPTYVLATREDHIVPWPSAYASARLFSGPVTYVLGASGHIAGVINPPSKNRRNFRVDGDPSIARDADAWFARAESQPGSWWPHWARWMEDCAGKWKAAPRTLGNADHPVLDAAPGSYVREASHPLQPASLPTTL